MQFDILTIFPQIFSAKGAAFGEPRLGRGSAWGGDSYFSHSLMARAQKKGLIKIVVHDLRKYATAKHKARVNLKIVEPEGSTRGPRVSAGAAAAEEAPDAMEDFKL